MSVESLSVRPGTNPITMGPPPPVIDDECFARSGENVQLSFTIRDPQPTQVEVRLFLCSQPLDRAWSLDAIQGLARSMAGAGARAGNRQVTLEGRTLERVASEHGLAGPATIWEHPFNAALRRQRGSIESLEPTDIVYVPHPSPRSGPLAIGTALLAAPDTDESVEGGQRWCVTWDCREQGYDPLDPHAWRGPLVAGVLDREPASLDRQRIVEHLYYFPRFSVRLVETGFVHVSPTPPELVTTLTVETEDSDFQPRRILLADGTTRPASGSLELAADELPVNLFWS